MKERLVDLLIKIYVLTNKSYILDASPLELLNNSVVKEFINNENIFDGLNFVRIIGTKLDNGDDVTDKQRKLAESNLNSLEELISRKEAGLDVVIPVYMSEANTRKIYIDTYLKEAGWDVLEKDNLIQPSKACIEIKVEGMPNNQQVGYCDYVLFGPDGIPLAVVEAKKTSVDANVGKHQAMLYADCLEKKYGIRPAVYYTNGYDLYVIDGLYPARQIYAYHTLEELQLLISRRARANITNLHIDDDITNRGYQKQAIRSVAERFNENHRRALLVMATGTGKTRVAISLVDILTKNNWVKNVLFLADRTALVKQAKKNFSKHLPNFTVEELSGNPKPDMNARLMFSTYHTMINYIDAENKEFGTGRFDLIIIDEAHRSIFNKFGAIFDYFDCLLIGLTATPRNEIAKNTYDIFGCDSGEPTDEYSYEEAINDGFLVPYKVNSRSTNILSKGIEREFLSQDDKEVFDELFMRNEDDDEDFNESQDNQTKIKKSALFKWVYNKDTCRKVLEDLMENGLRVNSGQLIGKTIIFAYNQKHAQMIVDQFYRLYPKYPPSFCQLVVSSVKYADDLVLQFGENQDFRIAVSVDMLDTGVDITDVLNLVFFKSVKSKIKFIQMIGRGTRLCKDIFGKGHDKKYFTIFDYLGNFEYFNVEQNKEKEKEQKSLSQRIFELQVQIFAELQNIQYQESEYEKKYYKQLKELLYHKVLDIKEQSSRIGVRKEMQYVEKYCDARAWDYLSPLSVSEIIRHISALVDTQKEQDDAALIFDAKMYLLELALIVNGSTLKTSRSSKVVKDICTIATVLLEKTTIPQIAAKGNELKKIILQQFWENASLESLERIRSSIRDLMQFVKDSISGYIVDTDFDDELIANPDVANNFIDIRTYKVRVLNYLEQNIDSPVIRKIRELEQITTDDMKELEKILWNELGTKEEYNKATDKDNLAIFVRSLVGLSQEAIQSKFGRYLSENGELNSQQIEFIRSIITFVQKNGDVAMEDLINTPPFDNVDLLTYFGTNIYVLSSIIEIINGSIRT